MIIIKFAKNFLYIYMQFNSLYKFIQKENKKSLLNNAYSEIPYLTLSNPHQKIFKNYQVLLDMSQILNFLRGLKYIIYDLWIERCKSYLVFYDKLRNAYILDDYKNLRIFIVDFFIYELKNIKKMKNYSL